MHWTDRRRRFRAMLKGDRCYHPASVFDPLSARIAQDLGFEVGMFAGSTASLTVLGAPDLILITLSEFAGQAYRINRAFDLPLLVDADHGYGNALNVMRTVQELESAGVAALTIEDTVLPRPYGPGGRGLTSIEEGVGRMRAALAARQDPDLVIVGRTIAMGTTRTEDALARAKAYAAAGVDAFFFVGITERAQLEAAAAAIDVPIIMGGGAPELSDRDYLATRRVRVALQGHQPIMAAAQAVHDTLKALRDGMRPRDLKGVPSAEFMAKATRDADYKGWTKEFLGGECPRGRLSPLPAVRGELGSRVARGFRVRGRRPAYSVARSRIGPSPQPCPRKRGEGDRSQMHSPEEGRDGNGGARVLLRGSAGWPAIQDDRPHRHRGRHHQFRQLHRHGRGVVHEPRISRA